MRQAAQRLRTKVQELPAARGGRVVPFGRRTDAEASRLVELVATARGVPPLLLVHRSRCNAGVARARQLAMYLMHVALGRSLTDVGRCFGRDRTTVSHACSQIEDLREEPEFDAGVSALEAALAAVGAGEAQRAAG